MARKHMKPFNICNGYCTKIKNMTIPKGALYGRDKQGYWVCIHKNLYPNITPTLELYRWESELVGWYLTIEQSNTVELILSTVTAEQLNQPIEYPKLTGVHKVAEHSHNNGHRYHKCHGIKNMNISHEKRHDDNFIKLSGYESIIQHVIKDIDFEKKV